MSVRVRFAPSPTGYLHIGGARTALFNWLYARRHGGTFVLRIEDTDEARNSEEAVRVILDGLRWLGLDWDEGPVDADPSRAQGDCGPYFQSARRENYERRVRDLLDKDLAYEKDGAIYFRRKAEAVTVKDLVVGEVRRELTDREAESPDFVIVRSDGKPVFHLVNVVDDIEMGITHVIRGEDHLANTVKHLLLFEAFGAQPPAFAHIPLILNQNGSKMSKRDEGASLETYQKEGFVPDALVNFLCLLGWTPSGDQEILSRDRLIELFDLSAMHRANARFDLEKCRWMNWEYLRSMPPANYAPLATPFLVQAGLDPLVRGEEFLHAALATCQEKVKKLEDLAAFGGFYFQKEIPLDTGECAGVFVESVMAPLKSYVDRIRSMDAFQADPLQDALKEVCEAHGIKARVLVQPVRLACTGSKVGPSLYHLMEVLGRELTVQRLEAGLERCQSS